MQRLTSATIRRIARAIRLFRVIFFRFGFVMGRACGNHRRHHRQLLQYRSVKSFVFVRGFWSGGDSLFNEI